MNLVLLLRAAAFLGVLLFVIVSAHADSVSGELKVTIIPATPVGGAIPGDSFTASNCTNPGNNPIGGGIFEIGHDCAELQRSVTVPPGYGKYKFDFSLKGIAVSAFPVMRVWIDKTNFIDFTVSTVDYAVYSLDFWARTDNHVVSMQLLNSFDSKIDVKSLTITAYPGPPAPAVANIIPDNINGTKLLDANTYYKMTTDLSFPGGAFYIAGENSTIDCQGHSFYAADVHADNVTVKNCVNTGTIAIWENHGTVQNNTFAQNPNTTSGTVKSETGAPGKSGHLITGNIFPSTIPSNLIDDQILFQNVTDVVVSKNTVYLSADIEIEGVGYWHLMTISDNTFPSPSGAFIGGWFDDAHSQGFTTYKVSILNNSFKQSSGCWSWSTIACGGTDAGDQARMNSVSSTVDMIFSGNKVIP